MSNRETRFRAWQTVTKTMFYNIEKGTGAPYGNPPFADYLENSSMIIMQFTGLKDRDGKEIFEGDILDNASGMNNYIVSCGRLGDGENETDCYGFIVPQGLHEWHVKGNIYETPELIAKEDKS